MKWVLAKVWTFGLHFSTPKQMCPGVSLSKIPSTLATMALAVLYLGCQCRGSLEPTVLLYLLLNVQKIPSGLVTQIPELSEEGAWALSALNQWCGVS